MEVLANLNYSTNWNTTAPQASLPRTRRFYAPRDKDAFASYVREAVEHYSNDVKYWQVWNEPDLKGFWQSSPHEFAELLAIAHDAIKRANPDARVALGGLALGGDLRMRTEDFFDALLADDRYPAASYFDIVAFRSYGSVSEAEDRLSYVKNALASHGSADKRRSR